jgi:nucleotide-binding universal stress UspA family protein
MMFRDILIALDSSDTARRALDAAGELAMALNARLTIISVAPEVGGAAMSSAVDVEGLARDVQDETRKLIGEAVESLPEELPVTTLLKHGDAGERIVEQIEAGGHDLLVMGSRGRSRVAENLLGSTAAHVHFHASVAMLVIHPER